jgi:hypothetical protein
MIPVTEDAGPRFAAVLDPGQAVSFDDEAGDRFPSDALRTGSLTLLLMTWILSLRTYAKQPSMTQLGIAPRQVPSGQASLTLLAMTRFVWFHMEWTADYG